ncbi:MAG TPA: hypothetical protein VJM57_00895, partial [Thermodesulfobacteriota bacterium]|nr:hypothetical protein [Thermodesulfobacteriota bacterium]
SFVVFIAATQGMVAKRHTYAELKKKELASFYTLRDEYMGEKARFLPLERKLLSPGGSGGPGGASSVVTVIEDIGNRLGIKDRIKSVKPASEAAGKGYVQRPVAVEVEGITLNELVNLLYRVEYHRNVLMIKDFDMKAHFENPDLLDVTMQLVLVTRGA